MSRISSAPSRTREQAIDLVSRANSERNYSEVSGAKVEISERIEYFEGLKPLLLSESMHENFGTFQNFGLLIL